MSHQLGSETAHLTVSIRQALYFSHPFFMRVRFDPIQDAQSAQSSRYLPTS